MLASHPLPKPLRMRPCSLAIPGFGKVAQPQFLECGAPSLEDRKRKKRRNFLPSRKKKDE
jgi:hypothetical protein